MDIRATVATELPETLPSTRFGVKGSVCEQWRERNGKRYGPYYCLMWREGGRLRKRYLKPEEVDVVRASCDERRATEREHRARRGKALEGCNQYEWNEQRRYVRQMIRDAVGDSVPPNVLRKMLYLR